MAPVPTADMVTPFAVWRLSMGGLRWEVVSVRVVRCFDDDVDYRSLWAGLSTTLVVVGAQADRLLAHG